MKPVLLAMNNPRSADPRHALAPLPRNSAGGRLWQMLGAVRPTTMSRYMLAFERRNLLNARTWSAAAASEVVNRTLWAVTGRTVVVLGAETLRLLKLPRPARPGVWRTARVGPLGVTSAALAFPTRYTWLPHPSGRCRWYNEPRNRLKAGRLLARLAEVGLRAEDSRWEEH